MTDHTAGQREPPAPSRGSVASIDAQELMCELHHIAGCERHSQDVCVAARKAELAIARLINWVNELQMNTAERAAIEWAVVALQTSSNARAGVEMDNVIAAQRLSKLLERHK